MSTTVTEARSEARALTARRVKWIKEHARPAAADCLCGCGQPTKSRFVPGHDARLRRDLEATADAGGPTARPAREALKRLGWA